MDGGGAGQRPRHGRRGVLASARWPAGAVAGGDHRAARGAAGRAEGGAEPCIVVQRLRISVQHLLCAVFWWDKRPCQFRIVAFCRAVMGAKPRRMILIRGSGWPAHLRHLRHLPEHLPQLDGLTLDAHHHRAGARGRAPGWRGDPIIGRGRRGGRPATDPPCAHRRRGWNNIPNGSSPPLPHGGESILFSGSMLDFLCAYRKGA